MPTSKTRNYSDFDTRWSENLRQNSGLVFLASHAGSELARLHASVFRSLDAVLCCGSTNRGARHRRAQRSHLPPTARYELPRLMQRSSRNHGQITGRQCTCSGQVDTIKKQHLSRGRPATFGIRECRTARREVFQATRVTSLHKTLSRSKLSRSQ